MLQVKIKKNNLNNLMRRLQELDKAKVQVGYFPENGIHSDSGLTYAGLFAIQSYGSETANIPPRPVLDLNFEFYNKVKDNKVILNSLKKYFSGISRQTPPIKVSTILKRIGGDYVMSTRELFGDYKALTPNSKTTIDLKGFDAPLFWTGELRDNLSYSINGEHAITPQ